MSRNLLSSALPLNIAWFTQFGDDDFLTKNGPWESRIFQVDFKFLMISGQDLQSAGSVQGSVPTQWYLE